MFAMPRMISEMNGPNTGNKETTLTGAKQLIISNMISCIMPTASGIDSLKMRTWKMVLITLPTESNICPTIFSVKQKI